MPTKQETFDTVARHLLFQAKRSINQGFGCRYRSDNGMRCALGALIPDAMYRSELEGNGVYIPIGSDYCNLPTSVMRNLGHDHTLFKDLQVCHDRSPLPAWPHELIRIAIGHGLNSQVVESLREQFEAKLARHQAGQHGCVDFGCGDFGLEESTTPGACHEQEHQQTLACV